MGEALLAGLLRARFAPAGSFRVVELDPQRRATIAGSFPGVVVSEALSRAEGSVIATKPDGVAGVAAELAKVGGGRILSIAAGVTIATIESAAGPDAVVVRAMPNTPALVGRGVSCISAGSRALDDDLAWAESVLSAVGIVSRVPEPMLDAVTGLSGSGPAYVFLVAEALVDAGVAVGLPRELAAVLASQTIHGAGAMLTETGEEAAALRAGVTSPGGTTAAGLTVLERGSVRAAFIDAVASATARSRELAAASPVREERS